MTREYVDIGYLEQPYHDKDYDAGTRLSSGGFQFHVEINEETERAIQFEASINQHTARGIQLDSHISDYKKNEGLQFKGEILDYKNNHGLQFETEINDSHPFGLQFHADIDQVKSAAIQFKNGVDGYSSSRGLQFLADINRGKTKALQFLKNHYQSYYVEGYLEGDYGEDAYLTGYYAPRMPIQFMADTSKTKPATFQAHVHIANFPKTLAEEFEVEIVDKEKAFGIQFDVHDSQSKILPIQFETHILDKLKIYGIQFLANLQKEKAFGFQFTPITQKGFGVQFLSTIYNTKYLRILHNFKSRGLSNTNWSSTSTATGDFSPNNLDTDIVEQVWRSVSGVKSGIKLTCDIGAGQICYMDTLCILNHNMTVAANIQMLMSNDPLFLTGVSTVLVQSRKLNTYYIAPMLPTSGFRYFRLQIDDPTNSNAFVEIGTVLFGAADIIQGENFTDEVDFEMFDFSDTINTEGFTNVANSRALKRKLTLQFEYLDYEKRNYAILRNIYQTYRTSHKCMWIPTPDPDDQEITDRLAIFGKLTQIPKERHNNKGPGADYISFTIDLDESL